jgi:hypothetical protein
MCTWTTNRKIIGCWSKGRTLLSSRRRARGSIWQIPVDEPMFLQQPLYHSGRNFLHIVTELQLIVIFVPFGFDRLEIRLMRFLSIGMIWPSPFI